MKKIEFDNPHRRKHFEFFQGMNHPHFAITAPVDITGAPMARKEELGSFNTRMVYLLARAANELPEFRQRIRDGGIVEHELVHPSFTVPTRATDVFSFCTVRYHGQYPVFRERADAEVRRMEDDPSLEDEPGRDDYLFFSAIPWLRFTALQHAMNYHPHDSVPRISWGKFYQEGDRLMMPLSVQVHHALMDARHVAFYYQRVEMLAAKGSSIFAGG